MAPGDDGGQEKFAEAPRAAHAAVVVSGYDSPLYERLYSDWDRVAIPTTTGQGGTRQDRVEVLWSSRLIGQAHGGGVTPRHM